MSRPQLCHVHDISATCSKHCAKARGRRLAGGEDEEVTRAFVTRWLDERRSLLAAVRSRVLPEGAMVLMNAQHPDATCVPPLTTRPFSFAECLHAPPMVARSRDGR